MLELKVREEDKSFACLQTEAFLIEALKTPQAEVSTIHRFGPGIYIRESYYPKGTFIIGHEHIGEHINVLLKGKINVITSDGSLQYLEAPFMFTAQAGKKIGYTLEDVVWQNLYATTETDVEKLEKLFLKDNPIWEEHLSLTLQQDTLKHEEDRQDFLYMLEDTGWTEEEISVLSHWGEDCISFPEGGYKVAPSNSPIQGKGLFATAGIQQGEWIAPMRLLGRRTPAGYLVNHAKAPNAKAVLNDIGDMYLVATKEIKGMVGGNLGEELTLDYRQVMKLNGLIRSLK